MVGQEFVATAISHSLDHQSLANAYLFTGPRGVGKTSSARILATCLNCLANEKPTITPCGTCANCIEIAAGSSVDVIEIDGASNTGVGDVRAIKDEILFPPTASRFKIYIIDEVHMLSSGAFNALLKTIEEPPVYVKFIFATTESHKIPATIKSRTQQFNFKLISIDLIKDRLQEALNEVNISYEEEALFWLAKEARGSMRDAYTLLDQAIAISQGKITLAELKEKMGFAGIDDLNQLVALALDQTMQDAILLLRDFIAKGISGEQIIQDLSAYFHAIMLIKHDITKESLLGFPLASFSQEVLAKLSLDQTKDLLTSLFALYKSAKFSINIQLELELFLSQIAAIQTKLYPSDLLAKLSALRINLTNPATSTTTLETSKPNPPPSKTEEISISAPETKTLSKASILAYLAEQFDISLTPKDLLIDEDIVQITLHQAVHYQTLSARQVEIQTYLANLDSTQAWQLSLIYDKINLIQSIFYGEQS